MQELTLTVPALLFPAISLLLLAYTNRFLVLAQLIRDLHSKKDSKPKSVVSRQISNLRKRVRLIKQTQLLGVLSFILCSLSMFLIFINCPIMADIALGLSLVSLISSLILSFYEITISTAALRIELEDME